jgi:hypothetical protein
LPELDFTFELRVDISGDMIVGHYHPEVIRDPYYPNTKRRVGRQTCPGCVVAPIPARDAPDFVDGATKERNQLKGGARKLF